MPDQTALVGGTPGFHFTEPQPYGLGAAPGLRLSHQRQDGVPRRRRHLLQPEPDQQLHVPEHQSAVHHDPELHLVGASLTPVSLTNPFSFAGGVSDAPLRPAPIVTDPWNQPTARMNQWSASLERQLWSGGGLELQYLGSHSYHLDRSYYNNTPLPGPGSVNSRRPNPLFGVIRTINTDEIANYESMSVIFRQRMTHGLQMLASYTWSHTLDVSTDSNGGGTPMNPYNWRADYGNSNWDIRHRLVTSFVYDIPFFATSNPILKGAFAKWQTNGILTLQTGIPFNVATGTDTANTASSGTYRPNLVGAASETCGRGHLVGCIDPTAFTIAALYPATDQFRVWELRTQHLSRAGRGDRGLVPVQELPDPGAVEVPVSLRDVRAVQPLELRQPVGDHQHVVVRQYHELELGRSRHTEYPVGCRSCSSDT